MLHRAWTGSGWTGWHELGGAFTSLPIVLPSSSGAFDIFARGLDFQIYHANWKPNAVPDWVPVGGSLLGAPTAASPPAAVRVPNGMFLFVTATDGAVWTTTFDGRAWKPWGSLGPAQRPKPTPNIVDLKNIPNVITFTSEPDATALFPATVLTPTDGGIIDSGAADASAGTEIGPPQPAPVDLTHLRVDVFAVGSDNALWHKWLDKDGWHGETETDASNNVKETGNWLQVVSTQPDGPQVTSSCACIPSLVASHRAPKVTAMPPIDIKMVEPGPGGEIHLLAFDGTNWTSWEHGPHFILPSYYTFSIDSVQIDALRSAEDFGLGSDTDIATASLSVGKWPIKTATFDLGDVSTGGHALYNLTFGPIIIELCEPAVLTYSIVNSGNKDVAGTLKNIILKGGEDYVNDVMKSLAAPDPTTIDFFGADFVTNVGGGATIFGSLLGAGVGVAIDYVVGDLLLTPLLNFVFADCDGVVAAEPIGYQKGRDLQRLIANTGSQQKYQSFTRHLGSDSKEGCGGNSDYTVYWSIVQ
jgi:hypothetical protein